MTETKTPSTAGLQATFIGVTTILFDDGSESILIDGFFTRPSLFSTILWKIQPNETKVVQCMEKAGIDKRLKAVFVAHSHYDHALDSPVVCRHTGAKLVGSNSTRMIGKGQGLAEDQIIVAQDLHVLKFGAFQVTVIEGIHSPGDLSPGEIVEPLASPCNTADFKTGGCYSYHIEHGDQSIFVHPSANFVPEKLQNFKASTLFLGVGTLGKQTAEFRKDYWDHVAGALSPEKIVPIHWDNFWRTLDSPLSPLPWFADKWSITEKYLEENCASNNITLQILQAWEIMGIGSTAAQLEEANSENNVE